jgi:4-hydroxy-2-oxoheptanedioate aldolase
MELPKNRFREKLKAGEAQLGIWNALGGNTVPELLAGCGFDWVLIDTEHSPVEPVEVMAALQALAAYPEVSPVVRPVVNDAALIKRYLDMGAQTLLIPFVQTAEEARAAVDAMRYPPAGMRGVAGLTRASRFGKVAGYTARAEEELCLLVQVETASALEQLEEIAGVEGVDGVFIGPSDLSASLGYPGQPNHPEVVAAIEDGFARLAKLGVPGGILTLNEEFARTCIDKGTAFTAVGVDLQLLVNAATQLRQRFT